VDNAFGRLRSRFRLFNTVMPNEPTLCIRLITSAVLLHNYLHQYGEIPEQEEENHDFEVPQPRIPPGNNRSQVYRDRFVMYLNR
jgi:hypothetical protein